MSLHTERHDELQARLTIVETQLLQELHDLRAQIEELTQPESTTASPAVEQQVAMLPAPLRQGRRALLRTMGAGATALVAGSMLAAHEQVTGQTPIASAANGNAILLGQTNTMSSTTTLEPDAGTTPDPLLLVNNSAGSGMGIVGQGDSGPGVVGVSNSGADLVAGGTGVILQQPNTQAGPPTGGQHSKGEQYRDTAGELFLCTVAGTPGTWRRVLHQSNLGVSAPLALSSAPAAPLLSIAPATPTTPGSMSAADKAKLDNLYTPLNASGTQMFTDFNAVNKSGFYNGADPANAPFAGYWWHLAHVEHVGLNGYRQQTATCLNANTSTVFMRWCYAGGWTAWKSTITDDNVGWISAAATGCFVNGFSNWGNTGSAWDVYYRRMNGIVYWRGMISRAATVGQIAALNIPAGYQSPYYVMYRGGASVDNGLLVVRGTYIEVFTGITGGNNWISLGGLCYPAS